MSYDCIETSAKHQAFGFAGRKLMRDSNNKLPAKSIAALITSSILFGVPLLSTGCGSSSGTFMPDQGTRAESVEVSWSPSYLAPGLYSVFDDKSRSVKSARIVPLHEQDLLALINVLRQTGGELSFGLIGESSDRPLLRLRIPLPPTHPAMREAQNPFERAEQDSAFQEEMKNYETKHQRWEAEVNQRINAFMEAVRPRLQEPARDKVTDISSALDRAELFLNEPGAVWPAETHRYIILNSDGIDTAKRKPVEIKSGARLLLINGSGSLGTLASLHPLRFESKQAAFDFIAATELGRSE
jgi:hypothetical protein